MLLCIDCGNTNTVFSIWDGEEFIGTDVIISSTVPRVVFNVRVFCDRYFNVRPFVVGKADCALPAEPRVDEGTQVGPDRLVNAAGAFNRHGGDLIVVDFGTATTFDVISEEGNYLGGIISPGIGLSIKALQSAASKLPKITIEKPIAAIGKDTKSAMQSGIYFGYLGLIEKIVNSIKTDLKTEFNVIATGGLAKLFAEDSQFDHIDDNLTLKGLYLLASQI